MLLLNIYKFHIFMIFCLWVIWVHPLQGYLKLDTTWVYVSFLLQAFINVCCNFNGRNNFDVSSYVWKAGTGRDGWPNLFFVMFFWGTRWSPKWPELLIICQACMRGMLGNCIWLFQVILNYNSLFFMGDLERIVGDNGSLFNCNFCLLRITENLLLMGLKPILYPIINSTAIQVYTLRVYSCMLILLLCFGALHIGFWIANIKDFMNVWPMLISAVLWSSSCAKNFQIYMICCFGYLEGFVCCIYHISVNIGYWRFLCRWFFTDLWRFKISKVVRH
ncbi:hypothetical protein MA16_Dca027160 [Dendrobium catenatum]|uniref:Uncharacterized protein n=1 Tax=Dendrobium catenatum TaxID=906689 RepID=A0A2I0VUG1_9ASPA|nr:hypothetical protein MA16_Dca027160 [Dendrobium catenatum]